MKKTTKTKSKKVKSAKDVVAGQDAEREAILDEREKLRRKFPPSYAPDIGVFSDGKVEVMFKLTYDQAEKLARLLREHKE
jgi:hypothetical protein